MTDSKIFERVGNNEIGQKLVLHVFGPDFLYIAVIWAIFQMSGESTISKRLLNRRDIEKDMGVEIRLINFPGIPQQEKCDFLIFLISFPNSKGLVFNNGIPSIRQNGVLGHHYSEMWILKQKTH